MKKIISAMIIATALLFSAGCTVTANLTISPSSLATEVAKALETNGVRPNIDCGSDPIPLVNGTTVICALSVDGDPNVYDVTVVISEVDGTNYHFNAKVADTPR